MNDIETLLGGLDFKHWVSCKKEDAHPLMLAVMVMKQASSVYFYEDKIVVWVFQAWDVKAIAQKYGLWSDRDCVVVGWDSLERVLQMMKDLDQMLVLLDT